MQIDHIKIRRFIYRLKHDYLTLNNVVIAAAIAIAFSWIWGSIESMQRNYELQQLVDSKKHQIQVEKLRVQLLAYESKYYESAEYQELAIRKRMGKGLPGEKLLIVPTTDLKKADTSAQKQEQKTSNFQQWVNFLFGKRK